MSVKLENNKKAVMDQLNRNKEKALTVMGEAAVEITTDYMEQKYYHPIHMTGDLIRDASHRPNAGQNEVQVGNSLEYAPWVHNGTRRMRARPYLKDAILENKKIYEEVAAEALSDGF